MPKDEGGPVNPVSVFKIGAWAGVNLLARRGSFPLAFLEKGDEVAKRVDSFLMEKRIDRSLLSREYTGSNVAETLGVVGLAFPHLKPTAASRSGRSGD